MPVKKVMITRNTFKFVNVPAKTPKRASSGKRVKR